MTSHNTFENPANPTIAEDAPLALKNGYTGHERYRVYSPDGVEELRELVDAKELVRNNNYTWQNPHDLSQVPDLG